MSDAPATPWSNLGDSFLSEGDWAIGQGVDAPDRLLLRHLLATLLEWHPALSLLEVGSGPGIEVEGLAQSGLLGRLDYVGYDFTPELVEVCRERFPEARFEVVDAQEMSDDGAADVVWCRHVLEHVPDWERTFRNVLRAPRYLAAVSWFIRPTWRESDVGCGVAEGFLHHTVSARRAIELVRESGRDLCRLDFDHHLIRGSVWLLLAPASSAWDPDLVTTAARRFVSSPEFVEALIDVPLDARERERELLGVIEGARDALALAEPTIERVYPYYWTLAHVRKALARCQAALDQGVG